MKRNETTPDDAEERLGQIISFLPDATFVVDADGTIIAWNRAMEALTGCSADEMVGRGDHAYAEAFYGERRPTLIDVALGHTDAEAWYENLERDGDTLTGEVIPASLGDGASVLWCKAGPLRDGHGRIVGAIESVRDVTWQKRAERDLRESETKYRLLAENQRDVVIALTPGGTLTYCSPAVKEFGGYDAAEEIGEPITKYIATAEDTRHVFEVVGRAVQMCEPASVEFLYQPKEGEPFPVEATGKPAVENGRVVSVQAVLRNITKRKEAQERFRVLHQSSRDALMTLAPPDWTFTSGNPATMAMFRAKDEAEFTSLGPWDVSPDEQPDGRPSAEKAREVIHSAVRDGSHFFEWTHRRLDGEVFPATVLLTRTEVGGQMIVQATVRDVTKRKQAEQALREEQEKLARITGSARDAIIMMDDEGRVSFWNEAAETIFGYTADEALGRGLHPLIAPQRFHDAYRQGFAHFRQSGDGPAVGRTLELVGRRKDGQEVPIELSMSGVRLCDAWHAVGIVRDISERKRAEEALREKERHLSVILNAVQTALVIIDADTHTIVDVNPAAVQMVGLPKEQIVGRICHNFICPAERGQCPITDLGQDVDNSERFFLRADGTRVPCLKTVVPLVLKGKKYLLDCFVDISEQKRAEEALAEKADELARSNAELQEFAYVASHDLQEPLRMVASYVQLLQQRYGDQLDGAAEEFMEYAVDGARRMQALINDLLQYSRVGTRGKPFAPTDCEEVMNDVLANLEVSITETGAAVTHDPLPRVVADRGQLVRVFQNLIGNALKFCDATPEVHVSAGQVGGAWQFAVRDNGIGIPPEQREKVFVIFQRLHGWGEYAGTGMGLAITKKIVERHGGRIWVESEPDQGATFTFTLPNRKEPNRDTEPDDGNSDLRAVAHAAGGDSAC